MGFSPSMYLHILSFFPPLPSLGYHRARPAFYGRATTLAKLKIGLWRRHGYNPVRASRAGPDPSHRLAQVRRSKRRRGTFEPRPLAARIRGHLRVVNLDDKPRYAALSYVWGQPEQEEEAPRHRHWFVICGGASPPLANPASPSLAPEHHQAIPITENCWSALRNLSRAHGAMTIWVDAICINQADDDGEKRSQVPLMGRVYAQADTVYAWLGDGDDRTDRAMGYLAIAGHQDLLRRDGDRVLGYKPFSILERGLWRAVFRDPNRWCLRRVGQILLFWKHDTQKRRISSSVR